jgi:hypothetical protein
MRELSIESLNVIRNHAEDDIKANAIKTAGGIIIRLEGDPMNVRANSKRDLFHPSEIELDNYTDFDYHVITTPNIEELYFSLSSIFNKRVVKVIK